MHTTTSQNRAMLRQAAHGVVIANLQYITL